MQQIKDISLHKTSSYLCSWVNINDDSRVYTNKFDLKLPQYPLLSMDTTVRYRYNAVIFAQILTIDTT